VVEAKLLPLPRATVGRTPMLWKNKMKVPLPKNKARVQQKKRHLRNLLPNRRRKLRRLSRREKSR
jgi:hypothetical protein